MQETRDEILAERRAKIARLRGELSVQDADTISAPSLTVVDEFQESFSSADRHSGLVQPGLQDGDLEHKIFYLDSQGNRKKRSDFEFNNLVNEATRRNGKTPRDSVSITQTAECGSTPSLADTPGETGCTDRQADPAPERCQSAHAGRSRQDGNVSINLSKQFVNDKTLTLGSSITKLYQDGKYINSSEDLGYQSSVSSPNETKRRSKESEREDPNLLKVERSVDTFSQSLPETFLKSVKTDLSQSVKSVQDRSKSKVVYDPRIFGSVNQKSAQSYEDEVDDVEREYFDKMNKLNNSDRSTKSSFRQFLNDSFREDKGQSIQQSGDWKSEARKRHLSLAPVAEGEKVEGEPSPLECIDLGDPVYSTCSTSRTRSPTLSCRTEFTDPDSRGRSATRRSRKRFGLADIALRLAGGGKKASGIQSSLKRRSASESLNGSEFEESWRYRQPTCETCKHRRKSFCFGGAVLLAIDIFTICLIILLFNKMNNPPQDIVNVEARRSGVNLHNHTVNHQPQKPSTNFTEGSGEQEARSISPRSLEPRRNPDADVLAEIMEKLTNLTEEVNLLRSPPTFSCHRVSSHHGERVVSYDDCSIDTKGMDARAGMFTVQQDGVYQLTFTAMFVAIRGHMVSADLFLKRPGKDEPEIIGRSSAMVKEDNFFGRDDDLHATTSVIVLQRLERNDEVYVSMLMNGDHGKSHFQSDFSKKIHFTGLLVSR